MTISAKELDARMRAFVEGCAGRGVKLTHQRLEIYRELAGTETHPDADTLYRGVKKRVPTVSRDTVYRNLKLLAEHGLISVVGMSDERLRFDANMRRHHHFVCTHCGLIRDFESKKMEAVPFPKEASEWGEPHSLYVELRGICVACRSRG